MFYRLSKRIKHSSSNSRTKEMFYDVWQKSNFVKHRPTSSNIVKHGVQTNQTCFIQQCWMMFYGDVLLVWTGLKALQKLLKKLYKPRRINPRICGHYCVTLNVNGIWSKTIHVVRRLNTDAWDDIAVYPRLSIPFSCKKLIESKF